MKINIALFDKDTNYSNRLQNGLQRKYSKQITVQVFSDEQLFVSRLSLQHFDLVILSQQCIDLKSSIPDNISVAVLVDDSSIEYYEDIYAIGQYQNIEAIYKCIVGVCADNSANVKIRTRDEKSKIILFTSVQGGIGTSSLAAAYSVLAAKTGKKVLYLNLETFGASSYYFNGSGKGTFSDIIYTLKRSNANLNMKLQSVIKKDNSGVEFIDESVNCFDMLELNDLEVNTLIQELSASFEYDEIVIDYSESLSSRHIMLLRDFADSIVYVNDGSQIGNIKYKKFCETLRIIENRDNCSIIDKIGLIYNRFSSKTSEQLEIVPTSVLGGINRIEGLAGQELMDELINREALLSIS